MKAIVVAALLGSAAVAHAQGALPPTRRTGLVGVGVTVMSGYYSGGNKSEAGLPPAPTVIAQLALGGRVSLASGAGYRRLRTSRTEERFGATVAEREQLGVTVVPVLLRTQLGPEPCKVQCELLTGLTFRNASKRTTTTVTDPRGSLQRQQLSNRFDTFLAAGVGGHYQVTSRWAVQADGTMNIRLGGGHTYYYEYLPAVLLSAGVGYCLGPARWW